MITPLKNLHCISFKGNNDQEDKKDTTRAKVRDWSSTVDEYTREAAETTTSVQKGLGQVGTSALGIWAILSKPINKVVDFFTDIVKEDGKPLSVPKFDKHTGAPLKDELGNEIMQTVRKANWKKIGIAGGIAVVLATVGGILLAAKNKKTNATKVTPETEKVAETPKAEKKEETLKTEETENISDSEEIETEENATEE